MALHHIDILESLGLAGRSAELETRLTDIEQAVQAQPGLQSTIARLKIPRQGFIDWRASLRDFRGNADQMRQARQQRTEASGLLNQIDTNLYNLTHILDQGGQTPVSSEDLRGDVVDLDQAVLSLIRLFPGARRAGLFSIDQTSSPTSSARPHVPNRQRQPLPSLAPTDQDPTDDTADVVPPLQQRQSTSTSTSTSALPPRRKSSGGSIYNNIKAKDTTKMMCGTYYGATVVTHSQPLPHVPSSEYHNIEATNHATMLLGDAVGGHPFETTNEPEDTAPKAPEQGIFRRFTGKMSRKHSVK